MNATADGGMDRALTAWSIAGVRLSAQVRLPPAARDLIERLLCDVDDRLGTAGGAAEIKVRHAMLRPCRVCQTLHVA